MDLFLLIIELIDIDSSFLINLYSTVEDKYLELLYHNSVIISVIGSTQSESFVRYIKNQKRIEFYKKHLSETFPNRYF